MERKRGSIFVVLLGTILVAAAGIAGFFYWQRSYPSSQPRSPLTWEECLKIPGARKLMTYPGQCVTPDGRKVTQPLTDAEKQKLHMPIIDPTENWKAYSNQVYGFAFKYPNNIFVVRNGADNNGTFWRQSATGLDDPNGVYVVELTEDKYQGATYHFPSIMFFVYKTQLFPGEWLSQNGTKSSVFDRVADPKGYLYHSVSEIKDLSINGKPAVEFKNSETSTGGTRTILRSNSYLFDITNVETGVSSIPESTYHEILSTFKIF